ncbi:MAG: tRNA (adenosine(37)-N6)-dimethylallyltransferase MiaA [Asticcacaulis sp. 32-58-5]|nr:MAG: tRNA (adenosine(37)-N6)-dimethylallyltransferase MiaA [Asticcacaulis sp. 32-58-5]
MSASPPSLLLLAGPTASGKSALALDWAVKTGGIILNADSMQLYEDVPTLTARPSADDEAIARHVLYGHLMPDQMWSTGQWLRAATPFIDAALRGDTALCIVGGTGLYFLSLIRGLAEIPEISEQARAQARQTYIDMGEDAFRNLLLSVDPEAAARIMPNDQQRLTRAYEVWLETERALSDWQKTNTPLLPEGSYHLEVLRPDRDWLYARCDHRFDLMLDTGAVDEVEALMARGLKPDWPIMRVLGLPEITAYLQGDMTLEAARALAQQKTRNYAKRQMTWFRNQMPIFKEIPR